MAPPLPRARFFLPERGLIARWFHFAVVFQLCEFEARFFEDETHRSVIPVTISHGLRYIYGKEICQEKDVDDESSREEGEAADDGSNEGICVHSHIE